MKTIAIHTLGCKTNQLESSVIAENLKNNGFEVVDFKERADFYIVNTCSVTSLVDKESKYYIRKAKRTNPDARIIVTGCFAQVSPDELKEMEEVDIILGNSEKTDILKYINIDEKSSFVANIFDETVFKDICAVHEKTRANIKIQDGCNNRCSYCIIPYARGKSRSNKLQNIINNIKELTSQGYKEIILSGIHLGQWGLDFSPKQTLIGLLSEIEKVEDLQRYRISSLEPPEITDELIQFLASSKKFCHHLHLSLQSADNGILKLMKRNYSVEFYSDIIFKLKEKMPGIFLGCDIITGFPSETDEQFLNTLQNLEKLPLSDIHVFPYSKRKNTPAAKMAEQIPDDVKKQRAQKLKQIARQKKNDFLQSALNQTFSVLFEKKRDKKTGFLKGISGNYLSVLVDDKNDFYNLIKNVRVTEIKDNKVFGTII